MRESVREGFGFFFALLHCRRSGLTLGSHIRQSPRVVDWRWSSGTERGGKAEAGARHRSEGLRKSPEGESSAVPEDQPADE